MAITHGQQWVKSEKIPLDVQLLCTNMIIRSNVYFTRLYPNEMQSVMMKVCVIASVILTMHYL